MDGDASMESAAFAEALAHPSTVASRIDEAVKEVTKDNDQTSSYGSERTGRGMVTTAPITQVPNPEGGAALAPDVAAFKEAQRKSRQDKVARGHVYQALVSPHLQKRLEQPSRDEEQDTAGPSTHGTLEAVEKKAEAVSSDDDPLGEWAESFEQTDEGLGSTDKDDNEGPEALDTWDGVDPQDFVDQQKRDERKRTSLHRRVPVVPQSDTGALPKGGNVEAKGKGIAEPGATTQGDWQSAMQAVMVKVEELEALLVEEKRERREEYDLLLTKLEGKYSSPFGSELGRGLQTREQGQGKKLGDPSNKKEEESAPGPAIPSSAKDEGPLVHDLVRRFMSKYKESSNRAVSVSLPTLLHDVKHAKDVSSYPHHSRITILVLQYLKESNLQAVLTGMK